jgi:CheY-like chemotaxis protein
MGHVRTVLVIDDDTASAGICAEVFTNAGWHVIVATDGPRALQLALERHPDVILTDLYLPELDGGEIVRRVRATGSKVPVVMMSGSLDGQVRAFRHRADAYLAKPFDAAKVLDVVSRLVPERA